MAVLNKTLVASKYIENAQTTQYTSTNVTSVIDAIIVTNITGSAATFSINLVTSGDTAGNQNKFISTRTLQASESYRCPEVTGQTLQNGDFISAIAGTASAISLRISGRQIS